MAPPNYKGNILYKDCVAAMVNVMRYDTRMSYVSHAVKLKDIGWH